MEVLWMGYLGEMPGDLEVASVSSPVASASSSNAICALRAVINNHQSLVVIINHQYQY